MTRQPESGTRGEWNEPLSPTYGRIGTRRVAFRTRPVTIVGGVTFEPGMIRVRTDDGTVHRTLREYVTTNPHPPVTTEPSTPDPWSAALAALATT